MPIFSQGYSDVREKIKKSPRYTASCFNCAYYYQCEDDAEELCQNDKVLPYDMVKDGHNIYCSYWKPGIKKDLNNSIKTGRNRLD